MKGAATGSTLGAGAGAGLGVGAGAGVGAGLGDGAGFGAGAVTGGGAVTVPSLGGAGAAVLLSPPPQAVNARAAKDIHAVAALFAFITNLPNCGKVCTMRRDHPVKLVTPIKLI